MPYFICPNCKDRSVDHDGRRACCDQAVACERCGFGFLFELLDDYYPAPERPGSSSATATGASSPSAAASSS